MATVTLIWKAKTDEGWKRFSVITGRNGRIKKGVVLVEGKEISYPTGHFELRYYEDRQVKYRGVGTNATEAINERDKMLHLGDAKESAELAGTTVNEPVGRKRISTEAARWVAFAVKKGKLEAEKVNRRAVNDFMAANPNLKFVDEIDEESLEKFWAYLRRPGRNLGDRSVSNHHERIMGFLKFERVDHKDWEMQAPTYDDKLPTVYDLDSVEELFNSCECDRDRILVRFLCTVGLREQELAHTEWTDINLRTGVMRVTSKAKKYGWRIKDKEERDVPLPADLIKLLIKWRKAHPQTNLVLGRGRDQKPHGEEGKFFSDKDRPDGHFLRKLKQLVRQAGLDCGVCDGCLSKRRECHKWTLHKFRRTYMTSLLRAKVDLVTVQALAGHTDLKSTMRYLTPQTADEIKSKVNDVFKMK